MRSSFLLLTLGLAGVTIAVMASPHVTESSREEEAPPADVPAIVAAPGRPAPSPEEIAAPHLKWAQKECARGIDEHLKPLDELFAEARSHSRPFAEDALGWGSKWRWAADHVPFTRGGRHETFLRKKFEEQIFEPAQLEAAVRQVITGYLAHVYSVEGKMLVRLRADVNDFPSAFLLARLDEAQVRGKYDDALARAIEASGSDVRAGVATELVSIIGGEVLTAVALRVGVSAGILGTGAASGTVTLGVGVVVGLIVDQIVTWVWDWWADPKGNLATELEKKLDDIRNLIIEGTSREEGLRGRMRQFARERADLRRQAILDLLQPHTGESQ